VILCFRPSSLIISVIGIPPRRRTGPPPRMDCLNLDMDCSRANQTPETRRRYRLCMIRLCAPPVIEHDPRRGWQLVLWAGDAFDYSTPFRAMLAEMASVLADTAPTRLELPDYEDHEDFVRGTLRFGDQTLPTYYEHSLGYLAFTSNNVNTLQDIAERLRSHLVVTSLKAVEDLH